MFQFNSFRARLLVFFISLLSMVLGAVFFSVNQANISNARLHIEEALQITANTFAKTLEDREYILTDKVRLLSGDFAFKSAFSTRDPETILSALENHRQRVGASIMMLLSMDGATIADTAKNPRANGSRAFSDLLGLAMNSEFGEASAIQIIDGLAYQMVVVPLFTPEPSAWILIGFVIDDDLALSLREFTHSEVSLLYRIHQEPWQIISTTLPARLKSDLLDGYVDGGKVQNQIFELDFEGEQYLSQALEVQNGSVGDGVAILQRSLDAALVPYMRLRILMLALFGIGLILSIVGVYFIARGLSSPIEKLVKTTRRIEEGDYSEGVDIPRKDEIGKLAHSVNSMVKGLAERDKVQSLLGKVISREVADELLSKKIELGGEEREVTMFFSDIRSFTSLCEVHTPQEILDLLNRYLTRMSTSVEKYHGVVDKYIGDAIMALFGAPVSLTDGPQKALACALEMRAGLAELNRNLLKEGKQTLAIGMGINTDRVVAGNMGSINRLNYTVIGDGVNLASRLEGLTKRYGVDIILSQSTRDRCTGYSFRELDRVRVKGKDEPVAIFEPLPLEKDLPGEPASHLAGYNEAIGHYRSCDWDKAQALFERLITEDAERVLYQLYLGRIAEFRENPPPPDWDYVTIFKEK